MRSTDEILSVKSDTQISSRGSVLYHPGLSLESAVPNPTKVPLTHARGFNEGLFNGWGRSRGM